jgi:hypothetical protein
MTIAGRRIRNLEGEYKEERVFLVGNGPSIDITPLRSLNDEYTIAMNKINKKYNDTSWRPDFYFMLQNHLREGYEDFISENAEMGIDCIINKRHISEFDRENIIGVQIQNLQSENNRFHQMSLQEVYECNIDSLEKYWSWEISNVVYTYHSMYALYQIAAYMGFREIYLIGCDLGFGYYDPHMIFEDALDPIDYASVQKYLSSSVEQGKPIRSAVNYLLYSALTSGASRHLEKVVKEIDSFKDENHFGSNYQIRPQDRTNVNDEMKKSHIAASRICEMKNIDIRNATLGGELDELPRVDLESVVQ